MSVLLEVDDLKISARRDDDSLLQIVKGVSFNVARGEVVALIGESGSGKTTIASSALGYTKPGLEFAGGQVRLENEDVITKKKNRYFTSYRGNTRFLKRIESCSKDGRGIQTGMLVICASCSAGGVVRRNRN